MKPRDITIYNTSQAAWDAMYLAVKKAKRSVCWEMYIFADDAAGQRFVDLFIQKARAGVRVVLLLDQLGSRHLSAQQRGRLQAAGVELRLFTDRVRSAGQWWRRLWRRTHRKLVVIDEQVGFIGGVNIDVRMARWRDLHVGLRGNAVRFLSRTFERSYRLSGGQRRKKQRWQRVRRKLQHISFLYDDGVQGESRVRDWYIMALTRAQKRVVFVTPYLYPDTLLVYAMRLACLRGVQVDILMPRRSDVPLASHASAAHLALLSAFGARIFHHPEMVHAKATVVDGRQVCIGSSNLDCASFFNNYEANVVFEEERTVSEVVAEIDAWMADAAVVTGMDLHQRTVFRHMIERSAAAIFLLWHWRDQRL